MKFFPKGPMRGIQSTKVYAFVDFLLLRQSEMNLEEQMTVTSLNLLMFSSETSYCLVKKLFIFIRISKDIRLLLGISNTKPLNCVHMFTFTEFVIKISNAGK